jgi:hypothetical protein
MEKGKVDFEFSFWFQKARLEDCFEISFPKRKLGLVFPCLLSKLVVSKLFPMQKPAIGQLEYKAFVQPNCQGDRIDS